MTSTVCDSRKPEKSRLVAILALALLSFAPTRALAVPSFAIQTDQPCSACHVGSFGPRLKQAGRDFKLYGYVANDTKSHGVPISFFADASYTHTTADQIANQLAGYEPNDNVTLEKLAAYYGGQLVGKVGAFVEASYDAIAQSAHWEDLDIRYAHEAKVLGTDTVLGVTLNNAPTEADLWDSSPSWVFPFASSGLAPGPAASPLIEQLPYVVLGLGGYAMVDDTVYLEGDLYDGLGHNVLRMLGTSPLNAADRLSGPAFYWRAVLQKEFNVGEHYVAIGTYGVNAAIFPKGIETAGEDHYTDFAFDATYQWVPHPELSTSDMLSAHARYIREDSRLDASSVIAGTQPTDSLSSLRIDVAYSIGATYSPTVQYFRTTGSTDAAHWLTPKGSPDSEGWIGELDYVPWGKPGSPWDWLNARIALQYTAYTKFDGSRIGASDNDTLLLNVKLGLAVN